MSSYNCCSVNTLKFNQIQTLSQLLKLVGDESRLQILCLLQHGKHCVCEIIDHLSMSQSLVSHHLADLKFLNLIENHKQGRKVFYSLTAEGERVTKCIFSLAKDTI